MNQSPRRPHGGPIKSHDATPARPQLALERWRQHYEHYRGLAESTRDLDRVSRESYWQHAEHFHRMMAEHRNSNLPAKWIAVETPITERPPHRSVRADFPHTA